MQGGAFKKTESGILSLVAQIEWYSIFSQTETRTYCTILCRSRASVKKKDELKHKKKMNSYNLPLLCAFQAF